MDHAWPVRPGTFPLCGVGVGDVCEVCNDINLICCVIQILSVPSSPDGVHIERSMNQLVPQLLNHSGSEFKDVFLRKPTCMFGHAAQCG